MPSLRMRPRSVLGLRPSDLRGAALAPRSASPLAFEHAADVRALHGLERRSRTRSTPGAVAVGAVGGSSRWPSSSPVRDMISARSMTFSSSRMLPGQS